MEESKNPEFIKPDVSLLKKENLYLLAFSVALGLVFDILFYRQHLGLSYPLFVIAFYSSLFLNMKGNLDFKFNFNWLLSIPIIALSLTYLIFSNTIFWVLNFLAIPVLIIAHTILLTSNNIYNWYEPGFIADMIYGFFARALGNILKPFSIIIEAVRSKSQPGRFSTAGKALLGVLFTIPLAAIILSLLSSADEVFSHMLDQIPNIFDNLNLNEITERSMVVIIIVCISFSYLWSLFNRKMKLNNKDNLFKPKGFIDPVTVITIMVMVNTIYIVFTFIQFSYLFGSISIGLPENFTYAQYARRGFFELVAITLINLAILLGNINFMKNSGSRVIKAVKILNSILVVCTLIILVSAHFRMSLYEEAYGLTYLRILTHLFMLYLFILLSVTLYKIWNEKIYLMKAYIITSLITYTLINYINIDSIIAKNNIERYKNDNRIDILYLASLSYDAVPYLTELLEEGIDGESSVKLREMLNNKKLMLEEKEGWQAFNFSEYLAGKKLNDLEHEK